MIQIAIISYQPVTSWSETGPFYSVISRFDVKTFDYISFVLAFGGFCLL